MSKSTLFIAVQCCHCSTMQVKQQKKSNNKWNCVVCNLKQSITKIYAQSYQAKDIRTVVQSFNMSRKLDDELQQQQQQQQPEEEGDLQETVENNVNRRRTDWREYVDDDDANNIDQPAYFQSKSIVKELVAEPEVTTEFSEDLIFKKPKLMSEFGSSSFDSTKKFMFKPSFSKRGTGRSSSDVDASDLMRDVRSSEQQQDEGASTRNKTGASADFLKGMGRRFEVQQQQPEHNRCTTIKKTSVSKWSEYITEDDDNDVGGDNRMRTAFADDLRLMCGYKLGKENDGVDHLVQEDIHPDFM